MLANINWSRFALLNEVNIKNLYDMPGIYVLWTKYAGEKWKCFYVGNTNKMKESLQNHLSSGEKNEKIAALINKSTCAFNYALIGNKAEIDGVFRFLYDHYMPECNLMSPPDVKPIEVNLP